MAGLSGKQQDILFDLIYKGSPPLIEGEMFGIKDFSLGEENAHSMIDSLIQKNNLMNILNDPELLSDIFGSTYTHPGGPILYSGNPLDAIFNPQTHSFESYDESNPMNLKKGGLR